MKILESLKSKFEFWIWRHTPHCDEVTRLASNSLEKPLSFTARLRVRLHFVICPWCRRYFSQIHFLNKHAPDLDKQLENLPGRGLSADAKRRIRREVGKNISSRM